MAQTERDKKYAATEKGREARERAQSRRQAKRTTARQELAKLKRINEIGRRTLTAAKFSKQQAAHSISVREEYGPLVKVKLSFARHYRVTESETPQCVQGGVPRWSESILNPAYKKKLERTANSNL